jgi:hypothetical protein
MLCRCIWHVNAFAHAHNACHYTGSREWSHVNPWRLPDAEACQRAYGSEVLSGGGAWACHEAAKRSCQRVP